MDNSRDILSAELDAYIRQNLISKGLERKDFKSSSDSRGSARKFPSRLGMPAAVLDFILKRLELTFSEKLMQLIEQKGRTPVEIYTRAGMNRAHFAKIKADKNYQPTKLTVLAFAVVLHLNLDETDDLLRRAGYSLSHSSESDLIVEFFISRGMYNIDELNYQLDSRGHKPLTGWRKVKEE